MKTRMSELLYLLNSYNEQGTMETDEIYNVGIDDSMFINYLEEREFECDDCAELLNILRGDE